MEEVAEVAWGGRSSCPEESVGEGLGDMGQREGGRGEDAVKAVGLGERCEEVRGRFGCRIGIVLEGDGRRHRAAAAVDAGDSHRLRGHVGTPGHVGNESSPELRVILWVIQGRHRQAGEDDGRCGQTNLQSVGQGETTEEEEKVERGVGEQEGKPTTFRSRGSGQGDWGGGRGVVVAAVWVMEVEAEVALVAAKRTGVDKKVDMVRRKVWVVRGAEERQLR
ncbi:hypothetical protein CYMTET_52281 [Cymbomonas tetramitiformis]|uniref:Uncharacterized protein n=1 Tax=Cymbomonas tetramitiformis TaxID=36881 RepID=A0AAE0BJE2_9CHLO|nr:hypothetical protein CYMTET_52281 [Cymbomonas tetramitiformis]